MLASCFAFILYKKGGSQGYNEKHQALKVYIHLVGKVVAKLQDAKVKELYNYDPVANLFTAYNKLNQTGEDYASYPIRYLGSYVTAMITCSILAAAFSGFSALADIENVGIKV